MTVGLVTEQLRVRFPAGGPRQPASASEPRRPGPGARERAGDRDSAAARDPAPAGRPRSLARYHQSHDSVVDSDHASDSSDRDIGKLPPPVKGVYSRL
eukprot:2973513-Rhodomonas_salina.1